MKDLRDEYSNFYDIYKDMIEDMTEARKAELEVQELKKNSKIFSTGGNAQFLDQELSFFIQNLQKKAVESGLDENSLIPKKDEKDQKIFEYIQQRSRPQSAITGLSSPSKMSNSFVRDYDPAGLDETMRSSFYSTRNGGFNNQKGGIVDQLKLKNVLDLTDEDK